MSFKNSSIAIILFIILNTSVYYATKVNSENSIKIVLKDKLEILQTHYDILLESQNKKA